MNDVDSYRFPSDFLWGAATAAYQIEGAAGEDGRRPSVWDTFCRLPGKVFSGHDGSVACDHYHLFPQDIELMKSLDIRHYRLSIAWPRVIPAGDGSVNPKGLDFYDRLIDALLDAGITPYVTLYHWDLPQALEDKGGWRSRRTALAFDRYARTVVRRLGSRVKNWFTVNEIVCFTKLAYEFGVHAPGVKEPPKIVNQIVHHALLAHGLAVRAVREFAQPGSLVGLVANPSVGVPAIERPDHIAASRLFWDRENAQCLAPVFLKAYPDWWLAEQGPDAPITESGDLDIIASPTDFLGLNIYSGIFVQPREDSEGYTPLPLSAQYPKADLAWLNVMPQALYWGIRHAVEAYGVKSLYVTENGAAYADRLLPDDTILDLDRREYLRNYLIQVHRALAEGFPVKGYFAWSLMDNFEWAEGYSKRFGIVYTDFPTQRRIPKLSARWYSEVIRQNRVV